MGRGLSHLVTILPSLVAIVHCGKGNIMFFSLSRHPGVMTLQAPA